MFRGNEAVRNRRRTGLASTTGARHRVVLKSKRTTLTVPTVIAFRARFLRPVGGRNSGCQFPKLKPTRKQTLLAQDPYSEGTNNRASPLPSTQRSAPGQALTKQVQPTQLRGGSRPQHLLLRTVSLPHRC